MYFHCDSESSSRPFSTTIPSVPAGDGSLLCELITIFQRSHSSVASLEYQLPAILHYLRIDLSVMAESKRFPVCHWQRSKGVADFSMHFHCDSGSASRPFSTTAGSVPADGATLLRQLRTIFQHAQASIASAEYPLPTLLHHPNMNKSRRTQLHIHRFQTQCQGEPAVHTRA